ncbi:hypothetical protein [Lentzea pudingi]|uniref:hypothetical protein n=1 Tax=Lentzea pudingi TaxID=1789439 RepID=UPI0016683DDF|nr:hypothetical protein [Lentzea pudingi]
MIHEIADRGRQIDGVRRCSNRFQSNQALAGLSLLAIHLRAMQGIYEFLSR